jgi:hypothetical protein
MPKLAATAAANAAAARRSKSRNNPLPRQALGRGAPAARIAEIKGGLALNGDIVVSDERAWLQLLKGNIGVCERHCRWPTPANKPLRAASPRESADAIRRNPEESPGDAGSTQQNGGFTSNRTTT